MGWATAALGLAGLICGIAALAADVPFLGLIAGILAVGAGAAGFGAAQIAPEPAETSTATGRPEGRAADAAATAPASVNDEITGLRSEAYFMAAASDRIDAARRYLRPVALMLLDIDPNGIGAVSPSDTGETLSSTLREADIICRRTDSTYAVLLEDTPETGALIVAERLRPALRGKLGDVVVHAGIACYPAHGLDLEAIWSLAEAALDAAQDSERDSTRVADSD